MDLFLKKANVWGPHGPVRGDFAVMDGCLADPAQCGAALPAFSRSGLFVFPGFTDVHVHLREPGFSYKETIFSSTRAAARGGYTTLCAMPNLNPVPDSLEHLQPQLAQISRDAAVRVVPYGAVTINQQGEALSDMAALAPYVAGFSDDGRGVQDRAVMREAMERARALDKLIAAHCEDESLLGTWAVHDGVYARAHALPGNDPASEYRQVQRDLELAAETGCRYHVCHVSTRQSVALIRRAKARGVDVSCETAPHYLLLDDSQLQDRGGFRMNPPIRSREDRLALVEGLLDGTIDMIATDHAPHAAGEKSGGLAHSLNGVVGLETAFQVLYTGLVRPGTVPLTRLVDALAAAPNRRFGLGAELLPPNPADFSVWDLDAESVVDPADFLSLGRSTPFAGMPVFGKCLLTVCRGALAWQDSSISEAFS